MCPEQFSERIAQALLTVKTGSGSAAEKGIQVITMG